MARKFSVYTYRFNDTSETRAAGVAKKISAFQVADWLDDNEANIKPNRYGYRAPVAEFPVSMAHDEETQQERAHKLCDYLNSIIAAQEQAVKDNALLQKIML